jgi:hypothetical protein
MHAGDLRHQIELRGPGVAARELDALTLTVPEEVVMRRAPLRRDIECVETEMVSTDIAEMSMP